MAPANQPRLSLTGSEDGEAETETSRAAKPLWRKTNRPSGPPGPNLTEPPGADPHAGWCGRGERAIVPPIPITLSSITEHSFQGIHFLPKKRRKCNLCVRYVLSPMCRVAHPIESILNLPSLSVTVQVQCKFRVFRRAHPLRLPAPQCQPQKA